VHSFPPERELQFLLANEPLLEVVSIGPFTLHLTFDNACVVTVEQAITYRDAEGRETAYGTEWRNEGPIVFHRLIQRKLVAVKSSDWMLELSFEGGESLSVHSAPTPYESGQIKRADGSLIVF
jgi:hypothetical protein